jgi:hypothetical protein
MAGVGTFVRALSLFAALAMLVPVAPALRATGTPATAVSRAA